MALTHVYVILRTTHFLGPETEAFPNAYVTFAEARNAILSDNFETLNNELVEAGYPVSENGNIATLDARLTEAGESEDGGIGSSIPNVEDASGITNFTIDPAETHIEVVKLPIINQTGGRRRTRKHRSKKARRAHRS